MGHDHAGHGSGGHAGRHGHAHDDTGRAFAIGVGLNAAFVIVEQNLAFLLATMDHALVLDHGECVLSGRAEDLPRSALEARLAV